MDETSAAIESIHRDEAEEGIISNGNGEDSEWKLVSYKRNRKKHSKQSTDGASDSETLHTNVDGSTGADDDISDSVDSAAATENGGEEIKKIKRKKRKKPKVTVAEAAAKISADDLNVFLTEITVG